MGNPSAGLTPAERDAYKSRLKAFMLDGLDKQDNNDERKLTKLYIGALNNGIVVVTGGALSLASFRCKDGPRPLQDCEKRFWVEACDLPERLLSRGEVRRACVEDKHSGDRRLELPADLEPEHTLHNRLDRGSGCWTSMHALYDAPTYGLHGTYMWDEPHKGWDDSKKNAIHKAGLSKLFVALVLICNWTSGPWSGAAFWRELHETTQRYCAQADEDDCLLHQFYEQLLLGEWRPPLQLLGRRSL